MTINNTTIATNSAGYRGGGGSYAPAGNFGSGGGVAVDGGTAYLRNSVPASNVSYGSAPNWFGTLNSQGYNCNLSTASYSFGPTEVKVQVTTLGMLSCLDVHRYQTNHVNAASMYQTGRYWTLTPTGSGYTVNLSLSHTLTDPTRGVVGRHTGGSTWDGARTWSTATFTRNGVTTLLGDWAVGVLPAVYVPMIMR